MTALPQALLDKPTLGMVRRDDPELAYRWEQMCRFSHMSRVDFGARWPAYQELVKIVTGLVAGRRLDLVACDLLVVVSRIEDVPQLAVGGWPIHPWLLKTGPEL